MSAIRTRLATSADADAALDAVRQSITVLCTADHQHDAATLERWLCNKTPEHFQRWCADPNARLVVAVVESGIAGVAELHHSGEIYLFYVRPDRVHVGVGRALMQALEAHARDWQIATLTLGSTLAARPFYERCGFTPSGEPTLHFGVLRSYPYAKAL
ncbi:MAG TPA: GNAT family N-acetyltransferase [Polyangiaceae bacterium]|nr:GNAT family N-acetyltransferase [Polyangiaceae bacterium]